MSTIQTLTRQDISIRWMVHRDLAEVVSISQRSPGQQWAENDFLDHLRDLNTIGNVAELGESVVGFMVYQLHREVDVEEAAPAVDPIEARMKGIPVPQTPRALRITLHNIAVSPELVRQGIGRILLGKLEQKIKGAGGRIETVVPESNLPMLLLLRDAGFKASKVLRRFFDDEDGYQMELRAA